MALLACGRVKWVEGRTKDREAAGDRWIMTGVFMAHPGSCNSRISLLRTRLMDSKSHTRRRSI